MIYQTNGTSGFYFYDGNIWTKVDGVAGPQGTDGADGNSSIWNANTSGQTPTTGLFHFNQTGIVVNCLDLNSVIMTSWFAQAAPNDIIIVREVNNPEKVGYFRLITVFTALPLPTPEGTCVANVSYISGIDYTSNWPEITSPPTSYYISYVVSGQSGPAGADGAQGPIGLTGAAGVDGVDGVAGPQGPQGETGVAGPQGEIGVAGPQGETGVAGPQGEFGVNGAQGPIGLTGANGVAGPQGPIGDTGVAGPQGEIGVAGPQGETGVAGPQGEFGVNGAQGPIGLTGSTGPAGVQGVTGNVGAAGPAGADGASYTQPTYLNNTFYAELGGYVIQISPNGKHGLVVAMQDQGFSNWHEASDILSNASNHDADGKEFSDWRLPTKRELNLMYGVYSDGNEVSLNAYVYWSSTENGSNYAWEQYFDGGNQVSNGKSSASFVRAVRAF